MSMSRSRLAMFVSLALAAGVAGSCGCDDENAALGSCYNPANSSITEDVTESACTNPCPECIWTENTDGGTGPEHGGAAGSVGPS